MSRRIIGLFLSLLLCAAMAISAFAAENTAFLYDEADLLSTSEETALIKKLAAVSTEYEAQIVVVTMASTDGGNIDTYVDDVYDSMGFGFGENHDGVLLLVCMDPREYRIVSNGYAGVAIGPDQIDKWNMYIPPVIAQLFTMELSEFSTF